MRSTDFHVEVFCIGISWLQFTSVLPAQVVVTYLHFGKEMYLMHVTMFINMLLHALHFHMCIGITCRYGALQVFYPTSIVVQLALAGQSFILLLFAMLFRESAGINTASCSHVNTIFSKISALNVVYEHTCYFSSFSPVVHILIYLSALIYWMLDKFMDHRLFRLSVHVHDD